MTNKRTTTKAKVTLYLEWDIEPTYKNRLEMEKVLAHTCHELGQENRLSWEDVSLNDYSYKIDLNLRKKEYNNKTKGKQ